MVGKDGEFGDIFRVPPEGRIGIELVLATDGRAPSIAKAQEVLFKAKLAQIFVSSTIRVIDVHYGNDGEKIDPNHLDAVNQYISFLNSPEFRQADHFSEEFGALCQQKAWELSRRLWDISYLFPLSPFYPSIDSELHFEFVGAFRENPLKFRFLGYAAGGALVVAVVVFASVHVQKELGAPECRARYQEIVSNQTQMLRDQAKLEGKWTAEHGKSFEVATNAAQAAAAACGSALSSLGMTFTLDPFRFEITLGGGGARANNGR